MSEQTTPYFSSKHKRLKKISSAANAFAWIMGIIFLLQAILQILALFNQIPYWEMQQDQNGLRLQIFSVATNVLFLAGEAVACWLVLRGLALGLNMIIETDLNYRGALREGTNE